LVSFRQDGDNEVDKEDHVDQDNDQVEDLSDILAKEEIVVDCKVPNSQGALEQQNKDFGKAFVLR
jgi:hypothetical protein